jgi:hypothetical protein
MAMIPILKNLTDDGRGVFLAAAKLPSSTDDRWALVTVSRNSYGQIIDLAKRAYGRNPFHLRKLVDHSLLSAAPNLHKNIRYHEITVACSADQLIDALKSLSPTYYENKGFALVDICGFSMLPSEHQISSKLILEATFTIAARILRNHRSSIVEDRHLDFSYHSTGDGFYMWSNAQGRHADSVLLALLLIGMTSLRRDKGKTFDIDIRAAFGIGEAYVLSKSSGVFSADALGDMLNDVARLVSFAGRNQLLMAECAFDDSKAITAIKSTEDLVSRIPDLFDDAHSPYVKVSGLSEVLWAADKHKKRHYFRNLSGTMFTYVGTERNTYPFGVEKETATPFKSRDFRTG